MADGAVVSFPAAVFESDNFGGTVVGNDFGHNLGSGNSRFADMYFGVLNEKEDVRKFGRGARGHGKAFNFKDLTFADLVLFASCADDGDICHKRKRVPENCWFGKSRITWGAVSGRS